MATRRKDAERLKTLSPREREVLGRLTEGATAGTIAAETHTSIRTVQTHIRRLTRMRAVQITRFGGPEVLDVVDLPDPVPGDGQQLYDVSSTAGVNFADTHQIENSYLAQQELPLIPGAEFVGTPVGGGPRVVGLLDGGGYAEKVVAHDFLTWPVPDGVSDEQALAVVLQGATAWHLLRTSAHLAEGESVVVIAGAGGVGQPRRPAGQALGRRPGDRHRVQPGEARPLPRSSAPTPPSTRRWPTTTRRPSPPPCARPTAARRSTSSWR